MTRVMEMGHPLSYLKQIHDEEGESRLDRLSFRLGQPSASRSHLSILPDHGNHHSEDLKLLFRIGILDIRVCGSEEHPPLQIFAEELYRVGTVKDCNHYVLALCDSRSIDQDEVLRKDSSISHTFPLDPHAYRGLGALDEVLLYGEMIRLVVSDE